MSSPSANFDAVTFVPGQPRIYRVADETVALENGEDGARTAGDRRDRSRNTWERPGPAATPT